MRKSRSVPCLYGELMHAPHEEMVATSELRVDGSRHEELKEAAKKKSKRGITSLALVSWFDSRMWSELVFSFPNLVTINLRGCKGIKTAGRNPLIQLKFLKQVHLDDTDADSGFVHTVGFWRMAIHGENTITCLSVARSRFGDDADAINVYPNLWFFDASFTDASNNVFDKFLYGRSSRVLIMEGCSFSPCSTDINLSASEVTEVCLHDCKGTADLLSNRTLPKFLKSLCIGTTAMSGFSVGNVLMNLERNKYTLSNHLTKLSLANCRVNVDFLDSMCGFCNIRELDLSCAEFEGDAEEIMEMLARMKLRKLKISFSSMASPEQRLDNPAVAMLVIDSETNENVACHKRWHFLFTDALRTRSPALPSV